VASVASVVVKIFDHWDLFESPVAAFTCRVSVFSREALSDMSSPGGGGFDVGGFAWKIALK